MSNFKEPAFTIVDKRGVQAEEAPKPLPEEKKILPTDTERRNRWKNVAYLIVMLNGPGGQVLIAGRAVGLRMDGDKPFVADYILPPLYPRGLDWTKEATKRLDTFLGCECDERAVCAVHKMYLPQWQRADTDRLNLLAHQPLPEAVEVLSRVEMARKKQEEPRIIVPGRM